MVHSPNPGQSVMLPLEIQLQAKCLPWLVRLWLSLQWLKKAQIDNLHRNYERLGTGLTSFVLEQAIAK
jgi:hypothetical protein